MGDLNFDKDTKKRGWKGFSLALAICIVAVGGIATATLLNSMSDPGVGEPDPTPTGTKATASEQPVAQRPTDIPDDRTTVAGNTTAQTAETTASPADLFILPLTNEVIRRHSNGQPVYMKTMGDWRTHNGVDFKGEENQTVKALADGTIAAIEEDIFWGKTVSIDHGHGIISRYCGVTTSDLKAGKTVKAGDTLGILSKVPCEADDGAHLHLEVLVNGEYVDPIEAIGREVKYSGEAAASAEADGEE